MEKMHIYLHIFLNTKQQKKPGVPTCGFPIAAISKIEGILEKSKINYLLVDKGNDYNEEEKYINSQENNYDKMFTKSKTTININLRVHKISEYLMEHKDDSNIEQILREIEKLTIADGLREI